MTGKPIAAVAIDMDDTLYAERDFVFSGYRAAADHVQRRHGADILEHLTRRFDAGERGDLFTPSLQDAGCYADEAQVLELVGLYREHQPAIEPFDDVVAALDALRGKTPLCLITDGWAAVQRRKLTALGLEGYFDAVLITDDKGVEYWKPHPWSYEEAARQLGCDITGLVYVGDNPNKDFCTPRKLGMSTIRVRREGGLHAAVEAAPGFEADLETPTFAAAVAEILPRLVKGR